MPKTALSNKLIEKTPKVHRMANPNPNTDNLMPPWEPGESGNPNGRPRKLVSKIVKHLNDNGVENVTNQQVVGAIEVCLNLTEQELQELANDETQPYLIKTIASHISDSKDSFQVLSFILERAFGKPNSKVDLTSSDGSMSPKTLADLYDEERSDS